MAFETALVFRHTTLQSLRILDQLLHCSTCTCDSIAYPCATLSRQKTCVFVQISVTLPKFLLSKTNSFFFFFRWVLYEYPSHVLAGHLAQGLFAEVRPAFNCPIARISDILYFHWSSLSTRLIYACREQEGVEQCPRTLFSFTYIDRLEPYQPVKSKKLHHSGKGPHFFSHFCQRGSFHCTKRWIAQWIPPCRATRKSSARMSKRTPC